MFSGRLGIKEGQHGWTLDNKHTAWDLKQFETECTTVKSYFQRFPSGWLLLSRCSEKGFCVEPSWCPVEACGEMFWGSGCGTVRSVEPVLISFSSLKDSYKEMYPWQSYVSKLLTGPMQISSSFVSKCICHRMLQPFQFIKWLDSHLDTRKPMCTQCIHKRNAPPRNSCKPSLETLQSTSCNRSWHYSWWLISNGYSRMLSCRLQVGSRRMLR